MGKNKLIVDKGYGVCPNCLQKYPIDNFRLYKPTNKYSGVCKLCRHQRENDRVNSSIESYLTRMRDVASSRSNSIKNKCPFNITSDDLIDLWYKQKGKCFYTDELMQWGYGKGKSPYSASLDKIIPSNGYVKNNIVLCCNAVNTAKGNLSVNDVGILISKDWEYRIRTFLMTNSIK